MFYYSIYPTPPPISLATPIADGLLKLAPEYNDLSAKFALFLFASASLALYSFYCMSYFYLVRIVCNFGWKK